MQGSILRGVGALDRHCGCLDRSCAVLGRDDFGLDPAEYESRFDFAIEEAFSDPSGRVQYRLSPVLDPNAWPTDLSTEPAPVINVTGEQQSGDLSANMRKSVVSSTGLTGSVYFPSVSVEESAEDPWQPGVGSRDPWKSSAQAPSTAPAAASTAAFSTVASPIVSYQIDPVSAQLQEQHRAYLATRIDLTQLFKSDNGSREGPPSYL